MRKNRIFKMSIISKISHIILFKMVKYSLKISVVLLFIGLIIYFNLINSCPDNSNDISCSRCPPYQYYHEWDQTCCHDDLYTHEVYCISVGECRTQYQEKCYDEANFYTMRTISIVLFVAAGLPILFWIVVALRVCYIKLIANRRIADLQREDPLIGINSDSFIVSQSDCSICLVGLRKRMDRIKQRKCGHEFHLQCIAAWEARKATCPNCRAVQ